MCQLLQWYLIEREMTVGLRNPRFEPVLPGQPVTWKYRGQVVPASERISIEMEITAQGADDRGRYAIGAGWLWVDGLRIYQVHGLGMRVVPGQCRRRKLACRQRPMNGPARLAGWRRQKGHRCWREIMP